MDTYERTIRWGGGGQELAKSPGKEDMCWILYTPGAFRISLQNSGLKCSFLLHSVNVVFFSQLNDWKRRKVKKNHEK